MTGCGWLCYKGWSCTEGCRVEWVWVCEMALALLERVGSGTRDHKPYYQ